MSNNLKYQKTKTLLYIIKHQTLIILSLKFLFYLMIQAFDVEIFTGLSEMTQTSMAPDEAKQAALK